MMIVSDLEDMFVPLLDGFLCSPQDSRGVINRQLDANKRFLKYIFVSLCSLLDQIPQTFAKTKETETILAPVIQSGIQALKVKLRNRIQKPITHVFDRRFVTGTKALY